MASFSFTLPGTGKSFTIKGPDGFSEAQAKAIFDQQSSAGSLVGFKPGDILNSATQAAAGLPGALSQLTQGISGTTSIVNGSVLNNAVGQISGQVSQAINQGVSAAKQAIGTVTDIVNKVPITNGINTADFAKQGDALKSIGNLSAVDVKAGIAQASKLVGQAANTITNAVGVGKFGLDGSQLEAAGILKPGTAAQFLSSGVNKLTDVLKSPTVFTGKDGIKSLTDLLSSAPKQDGIQQNLMSQGLAGLKQQGIPVDKLSPAALAGPVLNAAKSLTSAASWAKGLPLPAGVKTAFDTVARDGAFAVDFANQKINNALKQQVVPVPAADTVNRDTLNAAARRVIGNAKVPSVSYSDTPKVDILKFGKAVNAARLEVIDLNATTTKVINNTPDDQVAQGITQLEQVVGDYKALDSKFLSLLREAKAVKKEFGFDPPQLTDIESEREFIAKITAELEKSIARLKQKVENSTA